MTSQAPSRHQLVHRSLVLSHELAGQADQARLIAQTALDGVLRRGDSSPQDRAGLREAGQSLELQAQVIEKLKDSLDIALEALGTEDPTPMLVPPRRCGPSPMTA